jgi:hypothetical protein
MFHFVNRGSYFLTSWLPSLPSTEFVRDSSYMARSDSISFTNLLKALLDANNGCDCGNTRRRMNSIRENAREVDTEPYGLAKAQRPVDISSHGGWGI